MMSIRDRDNRSNIKFGNAVKNLSFFICPVLVELGRLSLICALSPLILVGTALVIIICRRERTLVLYVCVLSVNLSPPLSVSTLLLFSQLVIDY